MNTLEKTRKPPTLLTGSSAKRFKSWLDRVVLICEGSGKKMSYSLDKILVVRLALILVDFLDES